MKSFYLDTFCFLLLIFFGPSGTWRFWRIQAQMHTICLAGRRTQRFRLKPQDANNPPTCSTIVLGFEPRKVRLYLCLTAQSPCFDMLKRLQRARVCNAQRKRNWEIIYGLVPKESQQLRTVNRPHIRPHRRGTFSGRGRTHVRTIGAL